MKIKWFKKISSFFVLLLLSFISIANVYAMPTVEWYNATRMGEVTEGSTYWTCNIDDLSYTIDPNIFVGSKEKTNLAYEILEKLNYKQVWYKINYFYRLCKKSQIYKYKMLDENLDKTITHKMRALKQKADWNIIQFLITFYRKDLA